MASDTQDDIALSIKKRARRRLVGAIALVIVMLIILPNILRESVDERQEPIGITMYETEVEVEPQPMDGLMEGDEALLQESTDETESVNPAENELVNNEIANDGPVSATDSKNPEVKPIAKEQTKPVAAKEQTANKVVKKPVEDVDSDKLNTLKAALAAEASRKAKKSKAGVTQDKKTVAQNKSVSPYLIQVGVFAEAANVERLQSKIKKLGFASNTSKVKTPKGEMIRLRVSNFQTRGSANNALDKLKNNGLNGMVLKND